jgi:hypothetical protein
MSSNTVRAKKCMEVSFGTRTIQETLTGTLLTTWGSNQARASYGRLNNKFPFLYLQSLQWLTYCLLLLLPLQVLFLFWAFDNSADHINGSEVNVKEAFLLQNFSGHTKKKTPSPWSASELCRPSDRRLMAMLVPTRVKKTADLRYSDKRLHHLVGC